MSIGENAMLNKLTYLLSYQIIAASKLDACILQCLSPLSGPSLAKVNACGRPFLSKINTEKPVSREVCKDDTAPTVKVRAECGGASCSTEKEGIGSNDAPKCYKPLHAQEHDSSLLPQRRGASKAADAVHQVNKTLDVCLLSWIAS